MSNAKLSLADKKKPKETFEKFKQEFIIPPTGTGYYQNDVKWKDKKMNYKIPNSDLFGECGCFITSISNIFMSENIKLPGDLEPNPLNLLNFINENGNINSNCELQNLDSFSKKFETNYYDSRTSDSDSDYDMNNPVNVFKIIEEKQHDHNLIIQYKKPGINSHFVKFESIIEEGENKFIEIWDPCDWRNKMDFNNIVIRSIRGFKKRKLKIHQTDHNQVKNNSSSDNDSSEIGIEDIFKRICTFLMNLFSSENLKGENSDNKIGSRNNLEK